MRNKFNGKIKEVVKVHVVNKGVGLNDKYPINKLVTETGNEYLHETSNTSAGGRYDIFFPVENYEMKDGKYDMSSRNLSRGKVAIKPHQYSRYIKFTFADFLRKIEGYKEEQVDRFIKYFDPLGAYEKYSQYCRENNLLRENVEDIVGLETW